MIWNIIVDSSCDLNSLHYKDAENEIRYYSVPFVITAKGTDFVDDETMDIPKMLDAMETDTKASATACPSPASWLKYFEMEGNCIAVTISKELSGSYNSACAAMDMVLEEQPDKNVAVVNSISAGAGLVLTVRSICKKIQVGMSFQEVAISAQNEIQCKRTIFSLCSFGNLIKNGRMSPVIGVLAKVLGFWGVGIASDIGTIEIKGKVRGDKKAVRAIMDDMRAWPKPISYAAITHCQNESMANALKAEMEEVFPGIEVEVMPTKGLCSYYAERHGMLVAYY